MNSDAPPRPADFLAGAFARLDGFAPDPTDLRMGLVFRVTGPRPALTAVRDLVAARVDRDSPLRQRLVRDDGVHWEDDPDFDVAHHVRELPGAGGALPARSVLAGPPDPARPPWGVWLSPAGPDSWDLHYLAHHARQDAAAAVRTVVALLGDGDRPAPAPAAERSRSWTRGRAGLLSLSPDLLRTFAPSPPAPVGDGPERLLAQRSAPLRLFREVSRSTGATVNQVHLAALAVALDRWSPVAAGRSSRQVAVPVDTRRPGEPDDDFANRIGLMRVALPSGARPADALRAVVAAAGRDRTDRHRRAWRDLADNAPERVAGRVLRRITDPTRVSVTLSSIRVDAPLILLGAPVSTVTAVPWLPPGHTCFALAVGYRDEIRLSALSPGNVPDPAELVASWSEAVEDIHRAHVRGTAGPAR
ncbi:WS/DGAT domain-containing protein [Saccharothrix yanglingensis]|uniref:O-acyltransferase WSD1 C-terminal domain-containing protein n=1 Tax=Saccharothrix yanglingensis TaxID=659496 RepID=A0ABU0XAX8_9PSEU|nr:WS/DGAT domain-containing protein [Saccharothrix yanglingensis]MDQ2589116.1 hypothetical protein [Saccharothrix yanglingensis]